MTEQLTFSEEESKKFDDFLNYIAEKSKFEFTTKDAFAFTNLYSETVKLSKKIKNHIFELKKVTVPHEDLKEKSTTGKRK